MPDLSQKFQELFFKSDILQNRPQQIQQQPFVKSIPINQKENLQDESYNRSLYPEEVGKKIREQKLKAQSDYEDFIESLTEDEINSLMFLRSKQQFVVDKKVLKSMGENGESLGIERMEKNGLIKRELIPDDGLISFRLSTQGHRVLRTLNR